MAIGDRLRQARTHSKLTLEQAGALAGVSKQAISQIEKGVTKNPEAATLEPLCRKLGVSLHWLMTGKGEMLLNRSTPEHAGDQHSPPVRDIQSRIPIPDPAILHRAVTLLLFDLDHGGKPRMASTATSMVLDFYRRIAAGEWTDDDERAFEAEVRSRGEKAGVEKNERAGKRGTKRRG